MSLKSLITARNVSDLKIKEKLFALKTLGSGIKRSAQLVALTQQNHIT